MSRTVRAGIATVPWVLNITEQVRVGRTAKLSWNDNLLWVLSGSRGTVMVKWNCRMCPIRGDSCRSQVESRSRAWWRCHCSTSGSRHWAGMVFMMFQFGMQF